MVIQRLRYELLLLTSLTACIGCTERVPTTPSPTTTASPAPTCTYDISATNRSHGLTADTGTVSVTTPAGCRWTVGSDASWLTFSPNSSAGDGIVSYSLAANTGLRREGRLTIAERSVLIAQAGTDSYTVSPINLSASAYGQSFSISVTAASGLTWTGTSNANWLIITSGSNGNGNGTLNFLVDVNLNTTQRSGTITVAGPTVTVATVTVTQAGRVPQPSAYDGQWAGSGTGTSTVSTPARVDLTLDVLDGIVTLFNFTFRVDTAPGTPQTSFCSGSSSFSAIRTDNGAFMASGSGMLYIYTITGTFTSPASASGTVRIVPSGIAQTQPWCVGATMNWTATKR